MRVGSHTRLMRSWGGDGWPITSGFQQWLWEPGPRIRVGVYVLVRW